MKRIIIALSLLAGAAIIFVAGLDLHSTNLKNENQKSFCPLDAKICSDGTTVGRTGSGCEFDTCPIIKSQLTQEDAKTIAQEFCIKGGGSLGDGIYNQNSKTWWFEANLNNANPGCRPACVVSESTKSAEINWRCTGLKESKKIEAEASIKINSPIKGGAIKSPLKITGEARGWYFEGSFPIELVDNNGNVLGSAIARATKDWMSEDFVPFEAELNFNSKGAQKGELIFKKDNPSGLPENDQTFSLPVLFK